MKTTREKIILGATVLVALAGAYFLLTDPQAQLAQAPAADQAKIQQIMADTKAIIDKGNLTPLEDRRLAMATRKPGSDPIVKIVQVLSRNDEKQSAKDKMKALFVYSGLIQAGPRRMAVINGAEYAPGEELEMRGYFVGPFDTRSAVIEQKSPDGKVLDRISLQYEEDGGPSAP
jgi:hypothetical protein